jgi:hypothetical protein
MDILFFVAQALAIAGIGYVVSQVYAFTAKYGDPDRWDPADFSRYAPGASPDPYPRGENTPMHLSFVPESVGGAVDVAVRANEDAHSAPRHGKRRDQVGSAAGSNKMSVNPITSPS